MVKTICALLAILFSCLSGIGGLIELPVRDINKSVYKFDSGLVGDSTVMKASFSKAPVNTLVVEFEATGRELVEIFSDDVLLYSREGTEKTRFCAFNTLETDNLTVKISGESVNMNKAELRYKKADLTDFRVTSYFVASTVTSPGSVNPECFDVITDAILFGCVTFDENGELTVDKSQLEPALNNIKNAIDGREVNVYINLLGPDVGGEHPDWYEYMAQKAQLHSSAFKTGKMEDAIASLLGEYGFDGVFFDYEYPIESEYWDDFSKFLVSLNRAIDKKIGVALADWDLGLSLAALRAVDMVEMMEYDLFNEQGHHADFDSAVRGVNAALDSHISAEKIDLGVPFYARPADKGAFWYNYNQYAEVLGKSCDSATVDGKTAFFNSWQTVYDKTAYAVDCGIGGMMVWHYSCDVFDTGSDLSLFGAMGACISDRSIV